MRSHWFKQLHGEFFQWVANLSDKLCSSTRNRWTLAYSLDADMMCCYTQGDFGCLLCINRHVIIANQNPNN